MLSSKAKGRAKLRAVLPSLAVAFVGLLPPVLAAETIAPGSPVGAAQSPSAIRSTGSEGDIRQPEKIGQEAAVSAYKADGTMPKWYDQCERNFRYPIPTDFEYAYIDRTGKVVISGPFNVAHSFSKGVARVMLGCYGIENGHLVYKIEGPRNGLNALLFPDGSLESNISGEFQGDFLDELAVCAVSSFADKETKKEWHGIHPALVDKRGGVVLAREWEEAGPYSDGLVAVLKSGIRRLPAAPGEAPVECSVPLWGYCDKSGADVITPQFDVAERFSEGLAAVSISNSNDNCWSESAQGTVHYKHPYKYCYINKQGRVIIPGPYMEARPFVNGLAAVMKEQKWGYIDKSGTLVVPCKFAWAGEFRDRLAPVEDQDKVGYINAGGDQAIPFKFLDGREFVSGLAPATIDGKHWGFIDESGNFVIAPIFLKAFPFDGERALVYIDRRKEVKPEAREAEHLYNSSQHVRQLGLVNDARTMCLAVLEVAPSSQWARKAKRLLETGLPQHNISDEVVSLYGKGFFLVRRGKLKASEDCFLQALALEPDYFVAAGALANIYIQQQRYDDAQNLLEKTLKRCPTYARGHWCLAQVYECKGQAALAKEALAKARALDPDEPCFAN